MQRQIWRRGAMLIVTLAAFVVAGAAQQSQNANQSQPNQTQNQSQTQAQPTQNQNANQPQAQPAQPQQKKSFWQKVRDAAQQGQNTMQQGTNTVQQGQGTVQQTGQQVQNGMQQVQNGAQQGVQQMQGVQQGASNLQSNQPSGAFSGGGGGAGACGTSCFDAGPFQANVSQMTMSQEGGWHVIRMNIQFRNATNQPLIIAYHDGSMVMVDNNGNTYIPAGGNPGELQGMGIDRGAQTDSQFVLAPGQTGSALFSVARGRGPTSPIGTGYAYNFTIDELQPQNGAMAIAVRTYNLNFPNLAPGTSSASFSSRPTNGVVAGSAGTSSGTRLPQSSGQAVTGQQQIVNGRPAVTTPTQATPTPVNAAMKTPVSTAKPSAAPVKPIPATTATKPATPPGKTPPPTTTTTTK